MNQIETNFDFMFRFVNRWEDEIPMVNLDDIVPITNVLLLNSTYLEQGSKVF